MAPLVFAPFVQLFGLQATPLLMLPALAVLIFVLLPRIPPIERLGDRPEAGGFAALRPYARPLGLLYAIVVLRTLAAISFSTFVPILLTRRGMSLAEAGMAVSIYLVAVGIGGFIGGPMADRFGPRRVIIASLVASVPFLATAPMLHGWMFMTTLALGGFLLQSTLPVNVTFGQSIAPISVATVSSLMMGFAWGMAGLSVPLVGLMADRVGIERTLVSMATLPLAAALLAVPLPGAKPGNIPRTHVPTAPADGDTQSVRLDTRTADSLPDGRTTD
jgi:FSR family fosmidomycin resistance protein-like MFS transporter